MSYPENRDEAPERPGATTAGRGTPFAVEVPRDIRMLQTIAVFLVGPVIWSAHFMVVYLVVEAGCTGSGEGLRVFDPPVPTIVTLVATAVAAVACLGAAAWGYRVWRSGRHEPGVGAGLESAGRRGSLALAGWLLSLLGFVTVLFVGLPALVLPAC